MANCVNKSLPEFKEMARETNINPLVLAAKISAWQEKNGLDNWPTSSDIMGTPTASTIDKPIKELEDKLIAFLNKIGVKIEELPEGDFVAKAKLLEKIIQVVQGKADVSTLPEEASHIFVAILKANGVVYQKLVADIESKPIYNDVFEEYKNIYVLPNGNPDIDRIKEEAVGKLIAKNIVSLYKSGLVANEGKPKSWLEKGWDMIKAVIKKGLNSVGITNFTPIIAATEGKTVDVYQQTASRILKGDLKGVNLSLPLDNYEMLQKTNVSQSEVVNSIRAIQNRIKADSEKLDSGENRHFYSIDKATDKERKVYGTPSMIASQDSRKRSKYSRKFISQDTLNNWDRAAKRGTIVHGWVQDIVENYVSSNKVISTATYKELSPKERVLYDGVRTKVEALIDSIKREDPTAIFMPEMAIYDPTYKWTDDYGKPQTGIAGSIDLLVVHGDGTVSIYDWKTTSKGKGLDAISIWKAFEYNTQVSLYKRMLMDGNSYMGVPKVKGIRKSRLVQISTESDAEGKLSKVELIGEIPVAGESTGNAKLDSKLEGLYNKFYKLLKAKPPKDAAERKAYYARVDSIKDTIINLHLRKGYATIIDNATTDLEYVNKILNKEDVSIEDLTTAKEVTDLYGDIMEFIDDSGLTKENEAALAFIQRKSIKAAKTINEKIMLIQQAEASNYGISVPLDAISKQVGFLEKNFRAISTVNHPMIAYLYEKVKRALYVSEQENNALRAEIIQHREEVKKWASSHGLSLQEAIDKIINKKTGNLIGVVKPDYFVKQSEARAAKNLAWFKENVTLDVDVYNKELKAFTESTMSYTYSKNPAKNKQKQEELIAEFKAIESNLMESHYTRIRTDKESEWFSEEWKELNKSDNKALKDFYDFFIKTTSQMAKTLPHFNHKYTFLPSVRKTLMEQLGNVADGKGLFENVRSRMSVNELNTNSGAVNEMTGETGGEVPLYFVEGIKPEDKSYDLFRVLQIFGEMASNYKNMSEIENSTLAALEILKGQEAYSSSAFNPLGVKISPMTQNPQKSTQANEGWVEMYEDFMNYFVYGVRTKNPSKVTEMLDSLNKFTSFNLLGLAPFPAMAALVANASNTQIQIARNIYFNEGQFAKSLWMLTGGRAIGGNEKEIAFGLLQLLTPTIDIRAEAKNRRLSTKIQVRTVTVDHFYVMLRETDQFNQSAVALSMLQNATVTKDGRIRLLSDYAKDLRPDNYYDKDTDRKKIDAEIAEKMKSVKSIMDLTSVDDKGILRIEGIPELSMETLMEFRQMIRQVNKNIIGNMDANDIFTAKVNAWVRPFLLFRNWMPRMIEERFGELRYNRELQRAEFGRYKTFFKHLTTVAKDENNRLKWSMAIGVIEAAKIEYLKQVALNSNIADDISEMEFIDMYKENMRASYAGLAITAAVLMFIFASIRAFDDDDDENLTASQKLQLKLLRRAYSEMSMFANPVEAINILKSPTASLAPLVTLGRALNHSVKELTGWGINDEEMQFKAKPMKFWMNFNPLAGPEKFYRLLDEQWQERIEDNKKSE